MKLAKQNCSEDIYDFAITKSQIIVTESLSVLALFNFWSHQIVHFVPETWSKVCST